MINYKENEITKSFLDADKIIKNLPIGEKKSLGKNFFHIIEQIHSNNEYTSKSINTQEITEKLSKIAVKYMSAAERKPLTGHNDLLWSAAANLYGIMPNESDLNEKKTAKIFTTSLSVEEIFTGREIIVPK
ncbi:4589_t:CDS:2 [Cetraspora pellucida]|uniref:4589_t:CDS:1 n=1 Tax=Cetraspora pellucida TaxID=1433469 RepID=A0A9N8ZCK2_9GLOM|nr:4589_t:CDS:2 [Cetraspora pellucida]